METKVFLKGKNVVIDNGVNAPKYIPQRASRMQPNTVGILLSDSEVKGNTASINYQDLRDENDNSFASLELAINYLSTFIGGFDIGGSTSGTTRVSVYQSNFATVLASGNALPDKEYFLEEVIDTGNLTIELPVGSYIKGHNTDLSGLISSENDYTMFTSKIGGSGNIFFDNFFVSVTGTNSKIYDLTDSNGTHTFEIKNLNYITCNSLGEIAGYRQIVEKVVGRFGGTPELTLSGTMNGYSIETSNGFNFSNMTSLFKSGTNLSFSSRFIATMNIDLPTTGAFIDFSESNILNDESLQLTGCRISKNGILNSSDATIYPNINHESTKSFWRDNVGVPNTTKYIKGNCVLETLTTIVSPNTYYPLLGTIEIEKNSHFDMPVNGQFRLLSGNGTYNISGDIVVKGTANDEIDIRVTKSIDDGVTFVEEINHIKRVVNNLSGGIDRAFFPISFLATLSKNERIRLEVENKSGGRNVTQEIDSYFIVTAIS